MLHECIEKESDVLTMAKSTLEVFGTGAVESVFGVVAELAAFSSVFARVWSAAVFV